MTKPIDWTKPLRVVGTHERVWPASVPTEAGIQVGTRDGDHRWMVGSNGRPTAGSLAPAIENIPAEPRIVERWIVVRRIEQFGIDYAVAGKWQQDIPAWLLSERPKDIDGSPIYRIARVLIEEPE